MLCTQSNFDHHIPISSFELHSRITFLYYKNVYLHNIRTNTLLVSAANIRVIYYLLFYLRLVHRNTIGWILCQLFSYGIIDECLSYKQEEIILKLRKLDNRRRCNAVPGESAASDSVGADNASPMREFSRSSHIICCAGRISRYRLLRNAPMDTWRSFAVEFWKQTAVIHCNNNMTYDMCAHHASLRNRTDRACVYYSYTVKLTRKCARRTNINCFKDI